MQLHLLFLRKAWGAVGNIVASTTVTRTAVAKSTCSTSKQRAIALAGTRLIIRTHTAHFFTVAREGFISCVPIE